MTQTATENSVRRKKNDAPYDARRKEEGKVMEGARSERAPKGRWRGQGVLGTAISKVSSFLKFANSQIPFSSGV